MANLITLSRVVLLIAVVVIAYHGSAVWQLINVALLIAVFVTDGLDGFVARARGETSQFGAMFDIAGDRIVELTLWIVAANLTYYSAGQALVAIWVPIVFVVRGVIVDTIRASQIRGRKTQPFDVLQSALGRWLVKSKFMRVLYAVLKAHAFCWLLLARAISEKWPAFWIEYGSMMRTVGSGLVVASVAICVLRAMPVIAEFLYSERDLLRPRAGDHD